MLPHLLLLDQGPILMPQENQRSDRKYATTEMRVPNSGAIIAVLFLHVGNQHVARLDCRRHTEPREAYRSTVPAPTVEEFVGWYTAGSF